MRTLFRPVLTGAAEASAEQTDALAAYLQEVVSAVATAVREEPDIALELEFARKYYLAVSRLRACALTVLPQTFAVDLPQELVDRVSRCKYNDEVKQVGVEWAIEMGEKLLKAGFPVLHFYTMTRTQQVQEILKALNLPR